MALRAPGLLFGLVSAALAQTPAPPSFEAEHVLFVDRPVPLAPELILSIFGNNLGPATSCRGDHDSDGSYPTELCATRVLVAGIPAGILYAQAGQINFQVPRETPIQGTAELVVFHQGRLSKPVAMPLGVEATTLSLDGATQVGMPVWLHFKPPYNQDSGIRYPFWTFPASFGCNEVEVRHNGALLPRIADKVSQAFGGTVIGTGNICGSIALANKPEFDGRFPLHLQYRFDQPGTYEVRLKREPFGGEVPPITSWTKIEILPADAAARRRWLEELSAHAPNTAADLLSDFLPSILGVPDDQSLRILLPYLYHPDRLVREYAMYGLTYWPAQQVASTLWDWVNAEGPSDAAVRFLMHVPEFMAAHARQLGEMSIPYLESNSPGIAQGAWLAQDPHAAPAIRARAEDAMIRAARHMIELDPENANPYVSRLGQLQDERTHDLLWDFVNRHVAYEQAIIALSWLKSLPDLPRLAQLALQPANGHPLDGEVASLPYALHNSYGDAAIPYLDTMLERSEFTFVRTNCARELMLANRAEGFAFVADAIANNRSYRQEMIQFLRDQFRELRQADDPTILKFTQARAAPK
jgi:hypothetical protein